MLKIGDKVKMNDKYRVADKNKDVVFTVISKPWNLCGTEVVKLQGYSGGYAVDGLTKVEEIKRYRCVKEYMFEICDADGFSVENEYGFVNPGSIWQENKGMIVGGLDHIHLDREDGTSNVYEWCEPTKEVLNECFEQIESIYA